VKGDEVSIHQVSTRSMSSKLQEIPTSDSNSLSVKHDHCGLSINSSWLKMHSAGAELAVEKNGLIIKSAEDKTKTETP